MRCRWEILQESLVPFKRFSFLPRCMECLRGLAMRKTSVRPSVKRVDCDKTEESSVQIFISHERSFRYSSVRRRMVAGGDRVTPFIWNFGSSWLEWVNMTAIQRQKIRNAEPHTDPLAFWILLSIQHCVKTVSIDYYIQLLLATNYYGSSISQHRYKFSILWHLA